MIASATRDSSRPTRSSPAVVPVLRGSGELVDDLVDARPIEGDGIAVDLDRRLARSAGRRPIATSNTPAGTRAPRARSSTATVSDAAARRAADSAGGAADVGQEPGVLALAAGAFLIEPAALGLVAARSPCASTDASSSPYRRRDRG